MGIKKIVLITTGQPACNPRIVKEAEALHAAGHDVTLLYCFFISWASEKDKVLLQEVSWKYKIVGGSPYKKRSVYLFTRFRYRINRILNRYIGQAFLLAERAQARAYDELIREAKRIKADWYIGHNSGALPVAVTAATFHGAKAGFDFEDHYRGENVQNEKTITNRLTFLENKYVPLLRYFSAASLLITIATRKNHPSFAGSVTTLLNCFPLTLQPEFRKKEDNDNKLQLFWFSQTIGLNRGLEVLIKALQILNDSTIHLTLAGRCNDDMPAYINAHALNMVANIHLAGIIPPGALFAFSAQFDVGMALEMPVPENRDICLTNKIFTYLLAGNAIILSETTMQSAFNIKYKVGESFAIDDVNALAEKIKEYKNTAKLNAQKLHNYTLAKTKLNWENESKKLLALVD